MEDSQNLTSSTTNLHRLLENRSTNVNEIGLGESQEFRGQGGVVRQGQKSSEVDHRRNWIPRRRNSSVSHNSTSSGSAKSTGMTRRCVCNLSQCASTNYMCKSERQILPDGSEAEGGCFIEGLEGTINVPTAASSLGSSPPESSTRPTSARRGCIEMLSREKQELCRSGKEGGLECCFQEDMCNYPRTFYPSDSIHPTRGATFTNSVNRIPFDPAGGRLNTLDHQVWLRAAVIAVPICGLIILILLIYVARKLLSSEEEYKENGGSYNYARKLHYHQQKAGELLIPNTPPHLLDLSTPAPPPGHCYWCSAPRSTAYMLPESRSDGTLDPILCQGALDDSLWNQLKEESALANQNPEIYKNGSPPSPPWQHGFNFLHSKFGLLPGRGRVGSCDQV